MYIQHILSILVTTIQSNDLLFLNVVCKMARLIGSLAFAWVVAGGSSPLVHQFRTTCTERAENVVGGCQGHRSCKEPGKSTVAVQAFSAPPSCKQLVAPPSGWAGGKIRDQGKTERAQKGSCTAETHSRDAGSRS